MHRNSQGCSEFRGPLAAALLWLAVFGAGCGSEASPRPDLVLITVDALAGDQLGCFDGPPGAGETVCALADSGTRFAVTITEGRGEASAAATVLTGLPSERHGVDDSGLTFLGDARVSIAERLTEVGYSTGAFVSSAILNHTRRFDQGFARYEDGPLAAAELAVRVERWAERTPSPRFAWIHLGGARLPELERLVSRLGALFEEGGDGAGVLFVALTGGEALVGEIDWRSHRVPMIWRAPAQQRSAAPPKVSRVLSSLLDVAPTLTSAARVPTPDTPVPEGLGRSLDAAHDEHPERFLLVRGGGRGEGEVGLASGDYLYVRGPSDLDGSGRPLPTSELERHGARFSTLPDPAQTRANRATLSAGPWREDVLRADSPVPRLEFHLARRLRERAQPAAD